MKIKKLRKYNYEEYFLYDLKDFKIGLEKELEIQTDVENTKILQEEIIRITKTIEYKEREEKVKKIKEDRRKLAEKALDNLYNNKNARDLYFKYSLYNYRKKKPRLIVAVWNNFIRRQEREKMKKERIERWKNKAIDFLKAINETEAKKKQKRIEREKRKLKKNKELKAKADRLLHLKIAYDVYQERKREKQELNLELRAQKRKEQEIENLRKSREAEINKYLNEDKKQTREERIKNLNEFIKRLKMPHNVKPEDFYEKLDIIYNDFGFRGGFFKDAELEVCKFYKIEPFVEDFALMYEDIKYLISVPDSFYLECNSIEKNMEYLKRCKNILFLYSDAELTKEIELLESYLNEGFLITYQLKNVIELFNDLISDDLRENYTEDLLVYNPYKEDFNFNKLKEKLSFKLGLNIFNNLTFEISLDDIWQIIKEQSKFYNPDRDIEIWEQANNNGMLYKDIANKYKISISNVSMIVNKVQGAINLYKGKILENKVNKELKKMKQLGIYKKIKYMGGSGEPDFVCYKENNAIDVIAVENLQINKFPFIIKKKRLRAEYKFAYEGSFKYKNIELYLIVNNNLTNKIRVLKLDYKNPENIKIT